MREGEKNTKFFHLSAIIRRSYNHIHIIKDENKKLLNESLEIGDHFLKNFQNPFTATNPKLPENLNNLISPRIIELEDQMLIQIPQEEEILSTIKSINSLKSPGPGGIPWLFYKKYWEIIKDDLIQDVQSFFRNSFIRNGIQLLLP